MRLSIYYSLSEWITQDSAKVLHFKTSAKSVYFKLNSLVRLKKLFP